MAEGKKKRPKVIVIILIAVAVVFHVIGLIKIIPEISKDIKERKEIEASVSLARANSENDDHESSTSQTAPITPAVATAPAVASMPDDTRNNVLAEVPDFATDTVNPDVIGLYIDAMHELYANEKNMDASEVLASGEVTKISFTTETGVVHDYYLVDGNYLVYNGQVYYVRNCQSLQTLLADKTLFYIDGV